MEGLPKLPPLNQAYDNVANLIDVVPNTIDSLVSQAQGMMRGLKGQLRTVLRPPF